jgi:hypothetical protein
MKKKKKTKVIEVKLGRHRVQGKGVYGFALKDKNKILIDPRQKGRTYMDTLIHEKLHLIFPDWSESRVIKAARELTNVLWNHSYRRVDNTR